MIELTPEQHEALSEADADAVPAVDPATNAKYVLVRAEVYDRLQALDSQDRGWASGAAHAAMEVFVRDGWDDSRMDVLDLP